MTHTPVAVPAPRDDRCELLEMRHDLFAEHFHVVDLAIEVARFCADPEPRGAQFRKFANALNPVIDVPGQSESFQPVFC